LITVPTCRCDDSRGPRTRRPRRASPVRDRRGGGRSDPEWSHSSVSLQARAHVRSALASQGLPVRAQMLQKTFCACRLANRATVTESARAARYQGSSSTCSWRSLRRRVTAASDADLVTTCVSKRCLPRASIRDIWRRRQRDLSRSMHGLAHHIPFAYTRVSSSFAHPPLDPVTHRWHAPDALLSPRLAPPRFMRAAQGVVTFIGRKTSRGKVRSTSAQSYL
jgi:hypothetical protein